MYPTYSKRVIAFIDILGFGSLVRRLDSDKKLHENLYYALKQIKHVKQSSIQSNTAQSDLEVSVFSDSIVISAKSEDYHGVIWAAIHLQCSLLAIGILVRGAIACGRTIHEDDILYGEGMLDAYHLESRTAIYPRIVMAQDVLAMLKKNYKDVFLKKDNDGMWFLNPFSMGILPGNSDALLEDGYDPHEESLKYLGTRIEQELSRLSEPNQLAKWNWLKTQLGFAELEFKKFGKPRFWRVMELNEKKAEPTN